MVESLGEEWIEGMNKLRIKGAWNERSRKWELEGLPRVLKMFSVEMFDEWAGSRRRIMIREGPLKGTQGPCEEEPTRECVVCLNTVGEPEIKRFVVLSCGHWMCEGCVKGVYKAENQKEEQPALFFKPGQLVKIKCSSCREISEHMVREVASVVEEPSISFS